MKQRILSLSILLLMVLGVSATQLNALCIYTYSQEKVYFLFADFPKVTLKKEIAFVTTNSKKEAIQFDKLDKFTFEEINIDSKVNNVSVDQPTFYLNNNTLYIYNNVFGDVLVYNINGQFVGQFKSDGNGYCKINIDKKGIYVIKNKKFNFKIIL